MRRTVSILVGLAMVLWFCWWSLGIAFAQNCGDSCGPPQEPTTTSTTSTTVPAEIGTAVTQGLDADGCLVTTVDGTITERVCPAYPLNPPDGPVSAAPRFTG